MSPVSIVKCRVEHSDIPLERTVTAFGLLARQAKQDADAIIAGQKAPWVRNAHLVPNQYIPTKDTWEARGSGRGWMVGVKADDESDDG